MNQPIELTTGDVTDMEARMRARYTGSAESVELRGTLRGPYCEAARTLPAVFEFRMMDPQTPAVAESIVTDPCLWSAELPHVYRVDLEAWQGDRLIAEYHDTIGLRRLSPRRPVDFAPGTG